MKVFLKVAEQEDIQSVLVYPRVQAGETALWGSLGTRVAGGMAEPAEIDITSYVSATEDITFGIEGLFLRNLGTINPFDGEIDFTVELRANGTVLGADSVRLKVAPWMMLSHAQASEEVWAFGLTPATNNPFLYTGDAETGYVGLDFSLQLEIDEGSHTASDRRQWFQDHAEIGFTQRPGGPKTHVVFQLPYDANMNPAMLPHFPEWPRRRLLGPDVGLFTMGIGLGVTSGDYGGNIEVLPPTTVNPLGRIVIGDTVSGHLETFLQSQQVQPLTKLPVKWLSVGHVDEVIGFTGIPNKVIIADPNDAWAQLEAIPPADRGKAVFFARTDLSGTPLANLPESGVVTAQTPVNTRILTGVDHRGKNWQYIRIYESSSGSNSAGQVAWIAPGGLGDGFIDISLVWDTTSILLDGGDNSTPSIAHYMKSTLEAPSQATWYHSPTAGDKYVLVEDTLRWENGTPAVITVQEVLADTRFEALNRVAIQERVNSVRTALQNSAGVPLTFIKVRAIAP